jgi:formylglycine-generating enzyme required for sulfatase activity
MKFYELLDVSPYATQEEIKAAYRIQVQLHHPDRLRQVSDAVRAYAEDRLKRINEAYTTLSDPAKRASYDAVHVRTGRGNGSSFAGPVWGEPDRERAAEYPEYYARPRRSNKQRRADRREADAWARAEEEARKNEAYQARQRKAAEEAERERRAAEERARQAARNRYPRTRLEGDRLLCALTPDLVIDLVRVPAGEFRMGSDPMRDALAQAHERPQHVVRLSEYFISRQLVTAADFRQFQVATKAAPLAITPGHEQHPVTGVSWDQAMAYCSWLSGPGWKYRLPTEAEWERAARGNDERLYPWGNDWQPGLANIDGAQPGTTPVGQYSPAGDSPFGLSDMLGNVWEWCSDWYDADEYAQRKIIRDPIGPTAAEGAVIRGGAFDSGRKHARAAARNWDYPFKQRATVGFRVVAVPVADDNT